AMAVSDGRYGRRSSTSPSCREGGARRGRARWHNAAATARASHAMSLEDPIDIHEHDILEALDTALSIALALWRNTRPSGPRSEEHTSELQSPYDLVCRLLLEKKKKTNLK